MKTFLVVRKQSVGCDYTIGCGVSLELRSAKAIDALLAEAAASPAEWGIMDECEHELSGITIHEVADTRVVPLDRIRKREREAEGARAAAQQNAAERAEYERLHSKYGGTQ